MNDRADFTSLVTAELYDEDGKIVCIRKTTNFLTDLGEALIADRLSDANHPGGWISHIGVSTGSGQTRADNDLDVTPGTRSAMDSLSQGVTVDDNDIVVVASFNAGVATGLLSEGAVFNEAAAGANSVMINYFTFDPAINKSASQSLVLTVRITCGAS